MSDSKIVKIEQLRMSSRLSDNLIFIGMRKVSVSSITVSEKQG